MLQRLTPAEYKQWARYWHEEPWGPWRDNMNLAVLGRELMGMWARKGANIDLDRFMIRRREQDGPNRVTQFIRLLFRKSKPRNEAKK